MKKVLIIDGQGGKIGSVFAEKIIKEQLPVELLVVGTNAIATQTMLKVGKINGATGESAICFNANNVDILIAPVGLLFEYSFFGEVTPQMVEAIRKSNAEKIIIPFSQCNHYHFIGENISMSRIIELGYEKLKELI
ncbi:DUF3842 family protein [Tuanshanicoccus lijuaniae]|uniref:DUF3842 family protein n=1 Tax=Aerococcaceae bacterium zg-1292 TaxID=2774330 RepID=UPI0019369AD6|nr:DUF3842 family protein [Aerococcaceae bacterium zg-1292]MBF6978260.1 DUF3842 family protein [Aerococcaceae bacterium zg-BR22]MBS4456475.1 DUF3842 family protein [Aerococcaceae bacterium zg-A91]MBS4458325.1 DUF3842 family protein [Aerococcaceae bacterium zg-BR33]QQA37446.1 DUF3842 family protein [Aerococcaceae bacterium zg-1292]